MKTLDRMTGLTGGTREAKRGWTKLTELTEEAPRPHSPNDSAETPTFLSY
jgi:hypothetical protein